MSVEKLEETKLEYCVCGEFHIAGISVWQFSVNRLLEMYPNVPYWDFLLLASNVSYLDNQRDMADEFLDGNIASEMTLGGAIVREILKATLYISTVFSYRKKLEKHIRISKMPKYKSIRYNAQEYLDELCRTIEKADGLEIVFEKYIPNKRGEYVFLR